MTSTFLEWLRLADPGEPRGNDELLRALLPLFRQVIAAHEAGQVAPLDGVDQLHVADGIVWFHADAAAAPTLERAALKLVSEAKGGVNVVAHEEVQIDLDAGLQRSTSLDVQEVGTPITRPVFLPAFTCWEHEQGHHDALTDIFSLGMLLAAAALGADFTEDDELRRFVAGRRALTRMCPTLHPVIARAIVRMTEVERPRRAQDLRGIVDRLERYREVDDRADREIDFRQVDGFVQADRSSRRKIVQAHLQARLFDISKRNRLIWFQPTQQMLDLTVASVPLRLAVETIRPEELFLWDGPGGADLTAGRPVDLDRFVRFEEAPWVRGVLDQLRAEDARLRAEVGLSELKLVVAFLNWHNLKEERDARIRSPLLLLPVTLTRRRGVRDTYVLEATSELAEVNPVLRHHLRELYNLDLPEFVDLRQTSLETLHAVVTAEVTRSEPGIAVHLITRPEIRLATERARRRLDAWRRRSSVSGRGLSRHEDVAFSYTPGNFQPLGRQLYAQFVKPEELVVEEHLADAAPVEAEPEVVETRRRVWQHAEDTGGPMDWAVDLSHCTLGNFNYRKMSLVRDYGRMLDDAAAHDHPAFDALFSTEARTIGAPPTGPVDAFEPFSVVPADPTQTAAILWARTGRDFIIQGPPGTGKSQTITNLIADFAARGKRVLFVCQKRAALDVVYHRLAERGLDELSVLIHDSQADKKPFLDDLAATYAAWSAEAAPGVSAEDQRAAVLRELAEPMRTLGGFSATMAGPAAGAGASVAAVIEACLTGVAFPALDAATEERIPAHAAWQADREVVNAVSRALAELGMSPVLATFPLRHVGRAVLESPQPGAALRQGLDRLDGMLATLAGVARVLGADTGPNELAEALAEAAVVEPLMVRNQLSLLDAGSAASRTLMAVAGKLRNEFRKLDTLREKTRSWRDKLSREDVGTALEQARGFERMFVLFRWLSPAWWRLRALLRARYDFAKHAVAPTWTAILTALAAEREQEAQVAAVDREGCEALGFEGPLDAVTELVEGLRARKIRARFAREPELVRSVLDARATIEALAHEAEAVFDGGGRWSLAELAERVQEARAGAPSLNALQAPLLALLGASAAVKDAVRSIPLTVAQWDHAVARVTLARTFRADRGLAVFDGVLLSRLQATLRRDVDRWLDLNARTIRERVRRRFQDGLRVSGLTGVSLSPEDKALKKAYNAGRRVLEREFQKVVRHRSIRELTTGDTGTVVYDLKPIWLMSPLSISDTIPLDETRFDVVIFDEASQIPLEEAVPAVYRAPQMLVVGDEMQLPPTSFFATSRDDADVLDADDARYDLDAESFLAHAALRLPSTMLGWHYRSRSEALIRFSNENFYGGRLWTIPDRTVDAVRPPLRVSAEDGGAHAAEVLDRPISYHRLTDAVYAQRRNAGEARYIAGLVRGLLGSGLTIGVVAFSEAQQTEIEAAFERLAEEDPAFRLALDAEVEREDDGQLVGLFVKNLENVQGDERDIILLSICYGPDAAGRMVMNFGPINMGGGEKRLNVVFSRAKRHMAVVSSIEHTAITNTYNEGAACFRRYLHYAEACSRGDSATAAQVIRASAPVSAGEAGAVVRGLQGALEDRGWEVERAVGSSSFRVDLAVRDPAAAAFSVAVLVEEHGDGGAFEQWHVRPTVLRAFGWRVVYVLAKDWLADADACVARVEAALRGEPEVEAPPVVEPAVVEAEVAPTLRGKLVLVTGALGMTRLEAEAAIQAAGGRVARAASTSVDLVVVGERPGGKLAAARQLGLREVDEMGFLTLLGRGSGTND